MNEIPEQLQLMNEAVLNCVIVSCGEGNVLIRRSMVLLIEVAIPMADELGIYVPVVLVLPRTTQII